MSKYERTARIESVGADGTFRMTLATEGEASDGHILSIRGGHIPERMPLLSSHWNDPEGTLGSITHPEKALKDSPPRLRATGQIEMDGPKGEVRRDLAHMIARGHISAVSIRWDEIPGKTVRRTNLPAKHPFYVDPETAVGPERGGSYFEEWVAREGSIVALPADMGAVIERADETEGEVSSFWRAMAGDVADQPSLPVLEITPSEPDEDAKAAAMLAALRADVHAAVDSGISASEITNVIANAASEGDFTPCRIGEWKIYLPAEVADQLTDERAEHELERTIVEPDQDCDDEEEIVVDSPEVTRDENETPGSSNKERVEQPDPLSGPRPLDSINRHLAKRDLLLQAKMLRSEREERISPLELVRILKVGLEADRKGVIARLQEEAERLRGELRRQDE
jgi:hypothetical protein